MHVGEFIWQSVYIHVKGLFTIKISAVKPIPVFLLYVIDSIYEEYYQEFNTYN